MIVNYFEPVSVPCLLHFVHAPPSVPRKFLYVTTCRLREENSTISTLNAENTKLLQQIRQERAKVAQLEASLRAAQAANTAAASSEARVAELTAALEKCATEKATVQAQLTAESSRLSGVCPACVIVVTLEFKLLVTFADGQCMGRLRLGRFAVCNIVHS